MKTIFVIKRIYSNDCSGNGGYESNVSATFDEKYAKSLCETLNKNRTSSYEYLYEYEELDIS